MNVFCTFFESVTMMVVMCFFLRLEEGEES